MLTELMAGAGATVPMTVMMLAHWPQASAPRPLPPAEVADRATVKAGLDDAVSDSQQVIVNLALHFAYGAAMGQVFQWIRPRRRVGWLEGALFGLGIWFAGYQLGLPVLGLHPPASREPSDRNAMNIGAHLVYGATLGALLPSRGGRTRA